MKKRITIERNITQSDYKFRICLQSRTEDEENCELRINIFRRSITIIIPDWMALKPIQIKVTPSSWSEADIKRLGRDYYYNIIYREYSISFTNEYLSLYYGPQFDDSSDGKSNHKFITYFWKDYTHIEHLLFDYDGNSLGNFASTRLSEYEKMSDVRDNIKRRIFNCLDYDGEHIVVSTFIEQRTWNLGFGYFKWIKYFTKPLVRRSLSLEFDKETGERKGSYKGGTLGTGIDFLDDEECSESAFKRYCAKNKMTYIYNISDAIKFIDSHSEDEIIKEIDSFCYNEEIKNYVINAINTIHTIDLTYLKQLIYKAKLESI
ncbi:MAG: hypothetical protein DRG78_05435 [Epsilonproteobacteria bacterium]|nr:MAG: hypothetical protein DRG78_05435 [Campylobacterota bacterium]